MLGSGMSHHVCVWVREMVLGYDMIEFPIGLDVMQCIEMD